MVDRGRSARGRDGFRLTPFLLATIVAALVGTGLVVFAWHVDVNGATDPGLGGSRASLIVAVALASVAWTSVIIAACYDHLVRHIDHIADAVHEAAADLIVQAEEAGVFHGMNIEAGRASGEPPGEGGGRVLPFRG